MFRATAQKALKSAASRLTPRGGGLATRRNMSGGGSIEEEIGKKKSRSHQNLFFPRTTIRSLSSLFDDDRYSLALLSLTQNRILLLTRKALLLLMRLLYSRFYFVLRVESQLVLSSSNLFN